MAALTKARATKRYAGTTGVLLSYGVAASTTIYAGALVALNAAGHAVPAADTAGLKVVGVAEETVKSGTTAGGDKVLVRRGAVYAFENAAGANALAAGDLATVCYVADDQTVQDTGAANDVKAGVLLNLDDDGAWVHVGVGVP